MAKKKNAPVAKKEVERLEVEGGILIKFEDGSIQFIPNPINFTAEQVESFFGSDEDEDEDSDEDEDEDEDSDEDEDEDSDEDEDEDEDEDSDEDEDEDEDLTGEALAEMDFEELEDVCDDHDLETDPDDFDEDDVEKLRKAIAKEMGLTLPKADKKAKGKKK